MTTINLSIVIPIYNVEKFVEECVLSVLNQKKHSLTYEIIVVDDGSPDNSFNIVNSLAQKNTKIQIIRQENKGLGGARNTGLQNANGDFIWFIDSDDWIADNAFAQIEDLVKDTTLDGIRISSADIINDIPVDKFQPTKFDRQIVSGYEIFNSSHWSPCVQFTIYNRQFLINKNLKQQEHLYHEDSEFSPRAYYYATRIYVLNQVLYYTRPNPNSITRSINFKKNFDCIRVATSLDSFINQTVQNCHKKRYYNHIATILNSALLNVEKMDLNTRQQFDNVMYQNKELFKNFKKSSALKYKIEGILFTTFPKYITSIYRILNKLYK